MNSNKLNSIPNKAIVLGKLAQKRELKAKLKDACHLYWIIVYTDTILCKEIINYDKKKGIISCHSLNDSPEYSDFELEMDKVQQLFMIIKKQVD